MGKLNEPTRHPSISQLSESKKKKQKERKKKERSSAQHKYIKIHPSIVDVLIIGKSKKKKRTARPRAIMKIKLQSPPKSCLFVAVFESSSQKSKGQKDTKRRPFTLYDLSETICPILNAFFFPAPPIGGFISWLGGGKIIGVRGVTELDPLDDAFEGGTSPTIRRLYAGG